MKVRLATGTDLPAGWHPGQPLLGKSMELEGVEECPFGPDCSSCRSGYQWHRAGGTHIKVSQAYR